MKNGTNPDQLRVDVQACIEPLLIHLNRVVIENKKDCDIIKINMRQYPTSATSETYELKIAVFKNGKPEDLFTTMKNFKTEICRTGTTTATIRINYLHIMLCGEGLREFDELASQVTGTTNAHMNFIKEDLLIFLNQ